MDALRNELANYIPWFLAAHIIVVITFMAGMLYLPRLFVYHTDTAPGSDASERFKVMETKLLRGIILPSLIAVWILGPLLAWLTGAYMDTWLHIKFVLVIILSGLHGMNVRYWRDFQADKRTRSARFYKIVNEVPAVLMVLIVILVKVQPFGD
ncbi:MAG TPA: CopD family protein [Rhizomicrobium sp.]